MQNADGNPYSSWQMWQTWPQQLARLNQQLLAQQAELQLLAGQMRALGARVEAAEARPLYHIDSLQYHFDQLKVEKLEGTLNIGMNPPGGEQLKEIGQLVMPGSPQTQTAGQDIVIQAPHPQNAASTLPGGAPVFSGPNTFPFTGAEAFPNAAMPGSSYAEIRQEIDAYLNYTAPVKLSEWAAELGIPLDPYHRRLIIEDIRKQMSERIQLYIQRGLSTQAADSQTADPSALQQVTAKTIRDIEAAMRAYLTRLQTGEQRSGADSR
jgi:spore germination protein PC